MLVNRVSQGRNRYPSSSNVLNPCVHGSLIVSRCRLTSNKGFLTQFYPDSSRTFKGECTRGDFFFREEKRLVKDREKKKRERENGRESRSYASWETNRIRYAITLLRTDRRPRGDSFLPIYICFFFFFSCIKDGFPLFLFPRAIGGNLGDLCFVFFFFFSYDWSLFI